MSKSKGKALYIRQPEALELLRKYILESKHIVLFPHTAPDGDALGSTLALCALIRSLRPDAECFVLSPDGIETYLKWLPQLEYLRVWDREDELMAESLQRADLFLHLDHNQLSRLRYGELVEAVKTSRARRVLIDHHLDPEGGFDATFSFPGLSSTSELVYNLVRDLGWEEYISPEMATLLLTGIVTDTGRLMYSCFYPEIYDCFARLIALGADYPRIIDQLSYHSPLAQLKLEGYMLHEKLEVYPELRTAVLSLTRREMEELGVSKGDTEGLVNKPLSVGGIDSVCFLREDEGQIKLSMRSVGDLPVNLVASRGFGGGGHLNAAGAECREGGLEVAKNTYLRVLKELLSERSQEQKVNE